MALLLNAAVLSGVALIAAATLAGAWLGRRSLRLPRLSLACAAVLLLVVVLADLLPDIWNDLHGTGLAWWPAAGALGAGPLATDGLVRRRRASGTRPAAGRSTAGALAGPPPAERPAPRAPRSAAALAAPAPPAPARARGLH